MKVWYDACTGKQVRYASAIGKNLRRRGHEFVFTTREHPDTVPLAKLLGEKPTVIGKYCPSTLSSRLQESSERIIEFTKLFKDAPPDVAVAHQSVELCRTAFGLGIPIVTTADTPYAYAVNKLTLPFAHTAVISEALPPKFIRQYNPKHVVTFRGVDEVAWIKDFKPKKMTQNKKPTILFRQIETKAAYATHRKDPTDSLSAKLSKLGNVIVLNRYSGCEEEYGHKEVFEDSADLVANADLVVGYGGTIGREAALQGIPYVGISDMAKTYVNTYLAKKGFPMYITTEQKAIETAKKHLGERLDVKDKLAALENPINVITNVVESLKKT